MSECDKIDEGNIKGYKIGRIIGKGKYGKCYLLTSEQDNKEYAGKFLSKKTINKENEELNLSESKKNIKEKRILRAKKDLISEIKIHQDLNHPNIVKLYEKFENDEYMYLILEYCSKGNLNKLLEEKKHLKEIEVQNYIRQLINALKYLHERNIIHRDLKLENIFLTDNMVLKLGDFGLAIQLKQSEENIKDFPCGTPNYMAPEIFECNHSKKSDIWALGIVMYKLLFGKLPYDIGESRDEEAVEYLKTIKISYKENNIKIIDKTIDLIKQLLDPDFKKRPSLDEILEHDFFKAVEDKEGNFIFIEKEKEEEKIKDENEINDEKGEENLIGVNTWIEDYFDFDNYNHCIYLLNNGYYGIFFDKNKNILLNPNNPDIIYYIENNVKKKYNSTNLPTNLKEEIDCFNCLKDKLKPYNKILINQKEHNPDIYLKKFVEEGKAKFFWFSNNDMQVFFEEYKGYEILYCKETKVITYVNLKNKLNYSIESIKKKRIKNYGFNKRFKFVTDTLYNMREKIRSKNN